MTAVANAVPPPFGDAIAQMPRPGYGPNNPDPQAGLCGKAWSEWFRNLVNINEKNPARVAVVALEDKNEGFLATDMTGGGQFSAGLYRINWNLRCVVAGNFGDEVQVEFAWTCGGLSRGYTGALIALDDTRNEQADIQLLIRIDGLTPITYAISYVSLGDQAFYDLDIVIEEVHA